MRRTLFALLAALMPAAAFAEAAPPPQVDPVTTIVRIDTDHDGVASKAEWVAYGNHESGFIAMDTNKDGRVTVAELAAFRRLHNPAYVQGETPKFDPQTTVRLADADRDGAVSEAEWVAYGNHGGAGFAPIDANHDGKITVEELTAYRAAHPPATPAR